MEEALELLDSIGDVTILNVTPPSTINTVYQITFEDNFDDVAELAVANDATLFASEELTLWFGDPAIPNEITLDPFTGADPQFNPLLIDSILVTFDLLAGDGVFKADGTATDSKDEFAIVAVHLAGGDVIYFQVEGFGSGASAASEVDLNIVLGTEGVGTSGGAGTANDPYIVTMALDGGRWTGNVEIDEEFDHLHFLSDGPTGTDYRILSATTFTEGSGNDVEITFTAQATDGDGDTATDTFDVIFDSGVELIGTDGSDVLVANGADQILIGGLDDDTLTGAAGIDTFVFSLAAKEGTDSITDFSTSEFDVLSFTDVVDVVGGGDGINFDDAVSTFGKVGNVVTLGLTIGTTIIITDVDNALNSPLTKSSLDEVGMV